MCICDLLLQEQLFLHVYTTTLCGTSCISNMLTIRKFDRWWNFPPTPRSVVSLKTVPLIPVFHYFLPTLYAFIRFFVNISKLLLMYIFFREKVDTKETLIASFHFPIIQKFNNFRVSFSMSVCVSVSLSFHPPVCPPVCRWVHMSVSMSVSLSVSHTVSCQMRFPWKLVYFGVCGCVGVWVSEFRSEQSIFMHACACVRIHMCVCVCVMGEC